MESHSGNANLENVHIIPGKSKGVSDPSTTSHNDVSRKSLPWLDNMTSVSPSGHDSAIEQRLRHQASELTKMRHSQEHEQLSLRDKEPTSQLRDRNEVLMEKQVEDQQLLQKKHRRQLKEEEEPTKEPKERRCSMQYGDGAIRSLATSANLKSNDLDRNTNKGTINQAQETYQIDQNVDGCLTYPCPQHRHSAHDVVGYNSGGQICLDKHAAVPNTYPHVAKSSPGGQLKSVVLPIKPCECNKPESEACGSTCSSYNPLPLNFKISGQHQDASNKDQSDPWRDIRMSTLQSEISEGQKTRQLIADAMAELTFNYKKHVVVQTAQQREENATKAFEQRQRDAEASVHITTLQIEKDSIDATVFWLREAKIAAEERRQNEEFDRKQSKLQEEKLIELRHKEIDLTEAAVSRQLAEQEATAVLRRMKDDDLERVRQQKHEILTVKSKHEIAVADLIARRNMAEMSAKDVENMRKHEESEAVKNRAAIEKAIARQHAIAEASAVADARRRTEYDVDSNAQRQSILKKAILRRDMEAIRAEARRIDAEEEAVASTLWRHEEDAQLEKRHKAMLQEAAKRRQKEEQALEAQKKKLIEDLANERVKKQEALQEQRTEAAANLKLKLADEAECKKKQIQQAEELFNKLEAQKLQTPPLQHLPANKSKITITDMPFENHTLNGADKNERGFGAGPSAQISTSRGPRQKTAPMTNTLQQRSVTRRQ